LAGEDGRNTGDVTEFAWLDGLANERGVVAGSPVVGCAQSPAPAAAVVRSEGWSSTRA